MADQAFPSDFTSKTASELAGTDQVLADDGTNNYVTDLAALGLAAGLAAPFTNDNLTTAAQTKTYSGFDSKRVHISGAIKNDNAGTASIFLYVQGDTTDSNYHRQQISGANGGGNAGDGEASNPFMMTIPTNETGWFEAVIYLCDDVIMIRVLTGEVDAADHQAQKFQTMEYQGGTATGITSVTVDSDVSDGLGVGSNFLVHVMDGERQTIAGVEVDYSVGQMSANTGAQVVNDVVEFDEAHGNIRFDPTNHRWTLREGHRYFIQFGIRNDCSSDARGSYGFWNVTDNVQLESDGGLTASQSSIARWLASDTGIDHGGLNGLGIIVVKPTKDIEIECRLLTLTGTITTCFSQGTWTYIQEIPSRLPNNVGEYASLELASNQTTDLTDTDAIKLTKVGGSIEWDDATFRGTLKAGRAYELIARIRPVFSGSGGIINYEWYDRTNVATLGQRAIIRSYSSSNDSGGGVDAVTIVEPVTDIEVELRIITPTSLTSISAAFSSATIKEIVSSNAEGLVTRTVDTAVTLSRHKRQMIGADTSGGAFTATLPASPVDGDEVWVKDVGGSFSSNNLTLGGNGNNIDGASTFVATSDDQAFVLVFFDGQWRIF